MPAHVKPAATTSPENLVLERGEAVPALIGRHEDFLIVAGLGGTASDVGAVAGDAAHVYSLAGAMGAAAMSRARGSDLDEAARLRQLEVEASYRSAERFGFDELISPVETRNMLLHSLRRALYRRQAAPEPVGRIGITP